MLKRLRVNNFRKLMNIEFRPKGINLLIGPNNSGKTSLCMAMRFLSRTAGMSLNDAVSNCLIEHGNILNAYFQSDLVEFEIDAELIGDETEKISFHYELSIRIPKVKDYRQNGNEIEVFTEKLIATSDKLGFNDTELLSNTGGKVRLLNELLFRNNTSGGNAIEISAPTDKTMLCLLFDMEANRAANTFKKYLWTWLYYSLDPNQMRGNIAKPLDYILNVTGDNLSSVLHSLHNLRPDVEHKLLEKIKQIEPQMDHLSFIVPDQEHVYMYSMDDKRNVFGCYSMSDGTLRYLAMIYIILSCQKQKGWNLPHPPIVMIEEPENGVFVGALKPLLEQIDPSGENGQFIFTSHNPYFIDLFDIEPEGIHVFKSDGLTSSINSPEKETLLKKIEDFPLGELHFRGLI